MGMGGQKLRFYQRKKSKRQQTSIVVSVPINLYLSRPATFHSLVAMSALNSNCCQEPAHHALSSCQELMSSSPCVFSASSFGPCQYTEYTLRSLSQLITPVLSTLPSPASAVLFRLRSIDSLNCCEKILTLNDLWKHHSSTLLYSEQVSSVSSRTVTQTRRLGL